MVLIQDRIELSADKLAAVQSLFRERYLEAAQARGMALLESRVSPPLLLQNGNVTLWQRWQVEDVGAWWAMRAQAGTPEVAAFWQEVDALCETRERLYLTTDNAAQLSAPVSTDSVKVDTRGYRETAQLALKGDADQEALMQTLQVARELPGLEAFSLAANLAPEYAAGHLTLDLLYPDEAAATAAKNSPLWNDTLLPAMQSACDSIHALCMETLGAGLRDASLKGAIKRTAFFRVLPGVSESTARRFEQDLLEMPAQIPEITNWRLSKAIPTDWNTNNKAWSYVWEQEFSSLDDLLGPYMINAHHWAHIDRWFDPESGVQAIDVDLSHAFSPLAESLMAQEAAN